MQVNYVVEWSPTSLFFHRYTLLHCIAKLAPSVYPKGLAHAGRTQVESCFSACPQGMTDVMLAQQAIAAVADPRITLLPAECQVR
jgi:hypothetical protein